MRKRKFLAIFVAVAAVVIAAAPSAAAREMNRSSSVFPMSESSATRTSSTADASLQMLQSAVRGNCAPDLLCIYANNDGGEPFRQLMPGDWPFINFWECPGCANGNSWNDEISAFNNTTDGFFSWYEDIWYGGKCHNIGPKSGVFNLPPWENDKASSIKWAKCPD